MKDNEVAPGRLALRRAHEEEHEGVVFPCGEEPQGKGCFLWVSSAFLHALHGAIAFSLLLVCS